MEDRAAREGVRPRVELLLHDETGAPVITGPIEIVAVSDDDLYKLTLPIPGDRYQDVYVNFRRDEENWHVATIWSVIAEVEDFNPSETGEPPLAKESMPKSTTRRPATRCGETR